MHISIDVYAVKQYSAQHLIAECVLYCGAS